MAVQGFKITMTTNSLTTASNDSMASNTANAAHDACGLPEVPAHPFFIFSYSIVCLVSLALNTITMRVYYCTTLRFHSSVTIYLKNLAAADFFLCLVLPLRIANYASKSTAMRHIYCNFGAAGFYLNMYASILFMDYIAANRYLKIAHPLETHALQTARGARCISIITWTSLSAMALIYTVVFLSTSWGTAPNPHSLSCESLHSHQVSTVYKIIHCFSALIFVIVLVSLILFYWGTVRRLQHAHPPVQTQSCHRKLSRSKRNMLLLVVVFCVCFVPYHLVRLPYAFLKPLLQGCGTTAKSFYIMKEVTVLLSVLNACMDPLIYFVFCKGFREQMGIRKVSTSLRLSKVPRDTRKQINTETGDSHVTVRCESVNRLHNIHLCQTELQPITS